jgi:hypothetical protein
MSLGQCVSLGQCRLLAFGREDGGAVSAHREGNGVRRDWQEQLQGAAALTADGNAVGVRHLKPCALLMQGLNGSTRI